VSPDSTEVETTAVPTGAVEAERSNSDTLRAVPKDFDKMAAHDPEAAVW
jgi:hypothetical protein